MKKKGVALLLAAAMALTGLTGCGTSLQGASSGQENVRLMVWSPQNDQSKDNGEWLQTMCQAFADQHPEWDITFVYGVADEASAAGQVSQDPEASADVFMYANDTLTTLTDANALVKFGGKYREAIESTNSQEALGENMGVASLPTFTLNGEEKQMLAYAGSKAIGVNPNSKHMVAAVELAVFLGSAQAQKAHYEMCGVVPCNTELLQEEAIQSDEVVTAQNNTFNNTSILQPFVSKMSNCWTPVENMGKSIRNGSVTHENAADQTEQMNEAMNSDGI